MRQIMVAGGLLAGVLLSPQALACCPTGTGGAPPAKSGLGESSPNAADLAPDSAYDVYAFELDGIRYVQLNDAGQVRFAVGYIGETMWAVPAGVDASRVRLPGDSLPAGEGELVYSGDITVTRYATADGEVWAVSPADR
jgi:hypothetical protein